MTGSSYLYPEFLTKDQLANLKLYKYAAIDRSLTTKYVLKHYWNWVIELFPMWMAPNLITLTGLMFMMFNVGVAMVYSPDMVDGPRWIYFSFAAGLWLYSTFDNVDGKQARRTGTSSPLGELFDHGCDALNCSFAAILQATAVGLGNSMTSVVLYGLAMLGFYLSTAEEYHTGILYLGYVNAPTEGVIISCLVFILSGIYGPGLWQNALGDYVRVPAALANVTLANALVGWLVLMFLFTHAPVCFYAMYKACRKNEKPFLQTMIIENMPIALYISALFAWVSSPYSYILSHHHYALFAITTGFVFGRMASKIILAHLTKSRFPRFTIQLVPLVAGAVIANLPRVFNISPIFTPASEFKYICAFFAFALIAYLRWASLVINSFCNYLGIHCLTIPKRTKTL